MKAVVIDDERLAVYQLEKMLSELGYFDQITTFLNTEEAAEYIRQHKADVAFIDIEMPGTDGMKLANDFQTIWKDILIIFVTAYDGYAVKAFELQALDYLVKPITKKRLQNTMNRLVIKHTRVRQADNEQHVKILRCFGELRYTCSQTKTDILLEKWRTKKTKELFCFLIHYREKTVDRDTLIELLWPEMDIQKAIVNLHSTVYQLRKVLDQYHLGIDVKRVGDGYHLELNGLYTDVDLFERAAAHLPELTNQTAGTYEQLLAYYKADYFSNCYYWWAEGEKIRLRNIYHRITYVLIDYYIKQSWLDKAIELCHTIQKNDPYEETTYMHLIDLYTRKGNHEAAAVQRNQLNTISSI